MAQSGWVHIIDDDEAVRDSVSVLLDGAGLTVTSYPSATVFLERLEEACDGCVVTDVRMPELSGLDLLHRLRDRRAAFPTIMLTGQADVAMAVQALKNGAVDFIEKPFQPETLLTAVTGALRRLESERQRVIRREDSAQRLAALSAREREVLTGLMGGRSNKEIARDLGISPRTVEAYRANLMMKMDVASLSELVRVALLAVE